MHDNEKVFKTDVSVGRNSWLGAGVVVSYFTVQSQEQPSELTLANIEAIGAGIEVKPIVQGPARESKDQCRVCKTHHVICEGRKNGGDCVNIHCLL